jgi:hypothetical protein
MTRKKSWQVPLMQEINATAMIFFVSVRVFCGKKMPLQSGVTHFTQTA